MEMSTGFIEVTVILMSIGYSNQYDTSSLPACTDPGLENPGYSSTLLHGREYWSHCSFPNPKLEQQRCGRSHDTSVAYSLCDPDNLFSSQHTAELDQALWAVEKTTPYQCTPWHGAVLNYSVILVVVRDLMAPDLSTNTSCINRCGEIMPSLDESTRSPTEEERQVAIDNYSERLAAAYMGYFCDNFAVITYWQNKTMISTAASPGLKSTLPEDEIREATAVALDLINQGAETAAFKSMIEQYRKLLLGLTPALILLIINVCFLVLLGVAMVTHLVVGNKSDYYDEEQWKVVLTFTLKILFGIWIIELLLMTLVKVQERVKPWIVVFPVLGLVAAAIAAIILVILESRGEVETVTVAETGQ